MPPTDMADGKYVAGNRVKTSLRQNEPNASYKTFYRKKNVVKSLSGKAISFGNHSLSTYSKCGLSTSSIGIIQELGSSTNSWTPSQIY